ncbi:hypothetical protein MTZ49_10935 [Entomomonas sp. E2T0]|uniref:hypothetical protein n=1 Tax=Entomomonas sp. E2T0 TaxID=2930213 RepID=UPI002228314C|nr:hypothetical protein [Entomomonas sp. E2T0]UYZ83114.1 hypothetical protein MTZ49_10935 [Entomomonas sp. E2T0]
MTRIVIDRAKKQVLACPVCYCTEYFTTFRFKGKATQLFDYQGNKTHTYDLYPLAKIKEDKWAVCYYCNTIVGKVKDNK